jgi:photosystem II stability/assembly factor-like uncharacterized protein
MNNEIRKALANRLETDAYPYWHPVGPAGIETEFSNWQTVSGRVRAIAVHPTDPNTVYIGAASGGIWKTTDGGENWQDIGHDLPSQCFGAIAIDPVNPQTVYAGSGESILLWDYFTPPGSGLFKSTDGGETWIVITDGFGSLTHFSDIIINPQNPDILFATICHGSHYMDVPFPNEGIWKSINGGINWTRCLDLPVPFDIAFHPAYPDIVYAAMGGIFEPMQGFYISTDQGETWTPSNNGLVLYPLGGRIQFDISPTNPNLIYAVIYQLTMNFGGFQTKSFKSTDGGANWIQISTGPLGGYNNGWYDQGWYDLCIAVDPEYPDHVLIGNVELHRTTTGSSFTPVRPFGNNSIGSLVHVDYHRLVYAPSDPSILYIACDGGIYRSVDKGYTAESLNQGLLTLQYYRIASHPQNPEIIVGGMQDNGTARTQDGGDSWHFINGNDGMDCFYVHTNPNILYNVTQYGDFYKSTTGGNTFMYMNFLNGAWITPVFMHPASSNTLYAATHSVLKSANGGGSWDTLAANITLQQISSLAQSQINLNNMILGTGKDHPLDSLFLVMVSDDEGHMWTDVTANIPGESRWISRVVTDPVDENTMYVLRTGFSPGNKVWKTTDLGQTWSNISGDLPDLPINDLFIDPDNTDHLYLANDIGIYLSVDSGGTWFFASYGIPFVPCIDFDYVKIDNIPYLRIGTYGRSIYEANLNIGVGIPQADNCQPAVVCYPNPTSRIVDFRLSMVDGRWVSLKVYDVTGKEVEVVLDGRFSGDQVVRWDAGGLPAGVYYYRLRAKGLGQVGAGKIVKY